jgi:hypothetical protein
MRRQGVRPIAFDWESGTATIQWLAPTVGLIRFLYPTPAALPFRGVCCIDIKGKEYEFKGMVFRAKDDAPTFAEHRAIKRYLASMGLVGKSRRLKNGNVVVKQYGNSAKTETVEKLKMDQELKVQEGKLRVNVELSAFNADGTVFAVHNDVYALDQQAFANLQGLFISGVQTPLVQIGQDLASKAAA